MENPIKQVPINFYLSQSKPTTFQILLCCCGTQSGFSSILPPPLEITDELCVFRHLFFLDTTKYLRLQIYINKRGLFNTWLWRLKSKPPLGRSHHNEEREKGIQCVQGEFRCRKETEGMLKHFKIMYSLGN